MYYYTYKQNVPNIYIRLFDLVHTCTCIHTYVRLFFHIWYDEVYLADDVKKEMGLEREDLVALAYFLGSDYCEGVHGVGIVNALEILQAFPMKQSAGGLMDGLRRFK